MAPSSIRKAIGAVKDQTSISLAKVAGNIAPEIEVLIVKATTHDDEPADEKYVSEILNFFTQSKAYVKPCVFAISKRLSKTHDWIVALKALMLVHKLLNVGALIFGQEIMFASRQGVRILNMCDFRDEAHSNSWDHSAFVRTYALYLDQKLEFMIYERNLIVDGNEKEKSGDGDGMDRRSTSDGDSKESMKERSEVKLVKELEPEKALERLTQLLTLLDRFLACRPTGAAKSSRMVLVTLYLLVKDSFRIYSDTSHVLIILLDRFLELDYGSRAKAFDAYVNASKTIDKLVALYGWCKEIGIVRMSEVPEVQKISDSLLGTLEGFLKRKAEKPKSATKHNEEIYSAKAEEKSPDMNEVKSLPAPENHNPPTVLLPVNKPPSQQVTGDLLNLTDDGVSADERDNKLALALFSAPGAAKNTKKVWEEFPTDGNEPNATSAWQNPAAEIGKADWELALVESSSHLSKQVASLAGGFDALLLNGMYDQGTVMHHVNNSQLSGSASSVALPGSGKSTVPLLALPAPNGTVQPVGQHDPFAASLSVPPPPYVQMADMERKQELLMQEQQLWQQYAISGMQGQMGLAKIGGTAGQYGGYMQPMTPFGIP